MIGVIRRNDAPDVGLLVSTRDVLFTVFLLFCLKAGWTVALAKFTDITKATPLPVAGFENVFLNMILHADNLVYRSRYEDP